MAQTDTEAIVDGVAHLAAPHALFGVAGAFLGDSIVN